MTERKLAEEAQRELLLRVLTAQEEEQRRISRELHDHMAQHLTALMLGLKSLETQCDEGSVGLVKRLQQFTNNMAQEVRTLATQLRPLALEDLGLAPALADYVEDWSKQTGVRADLHCNGLLNRSLPTDVENAVYRLVQEALTNVQKHAHAKSASIIVDRPAGHIRVLIEDDGCGFDLNEKMGAPARDRRLGLIGMQERAAAIDGTITIESTVGIGTTIILKVPI